MGYILSVSNLKGGVGKTTTAVNLAAALAGLNHDTLLVDCDPQGSATVSVGIVKKKLDKTLYDVLTDRSDIKDILHDTGVKRLKTVPVHGEFFRLEVELLTRSGRENVLKEHLKQIGDDFDYIVLDTPPSMGLISLNALTCSHAVIVPLQCEFLAYDSLVQFLKLIRLVKNNLNPDLKVLGVLLTMFDAGEIVSSRIGEHARKKLEDLVFETVIARSPRLQEASISGEPLVIKEPDSDSAREYIQLAKEIIQRKDSFRPDAFV